MIQILEFLNSIWWGHAVAWFGALWVILAFVRKVTRDADNDLNPESRKDLSDKLLRIKDRDASSWVPDFTLVFDRFFGEKHLSGRCFYRSALISVVVFTVLMYLYESHHTDLLMETYGNPVNVIIFLLFVGILSNVCIDYLSLLETRIILCIRIPILAKIVLDAMLTTLFVILWISIINYIERRDIFESIIYVSETMFYESTNFTVYYQIILATSFTTSIWLWLHGLSRVLIRSLSNVQKFMSWLNVKETPLRAIGTTINLIVLTFGILLLPVYLLIKPFHP